MIICTCKNINEARIRAAIAKGAASVDEVCLATGACTQCQQCESAVIDLVALATQTVPQPACCSQEAFA